MSFSKECDFRSEPRLVKIDQDSKAIIFATVPEPDGGDSRRIKFAIVHVTNRILYAVFSLAKVAFR